MAHLVASRTHNPEVPGSNPGVALKLLLYISTHCLGKFGCALSEILEKLPSWELFTASLVQSSLSQVEPSGDFRLQSLSMLYSVTICATELGIQKKLLHSVAVGLAAMSTLTTRNAGDSFGWLSGAFGCFQDS